MQHYYSLNINLLYFEVLLTSDLYKYKMFKIKFKSGQSITNNDFYRNAYLDRLLLLQIDFN